MQKNSSRQTVLVIGATGRHGRTGARVVERLLANDRDVRVLVRTRSAVADELADRGAQIVAGDLLDRRTLGAAVDGVDAVYFAYPIAAGAIPAAANLASVLADAKLSPRLVVMSMAAAQADSPSALGRAQWTAEQVFSWAGLQPIVLRVAALFYENIVILHGKAIRETGQFANSFGAGRAPWISGRDAADLAVAALVDPDRYPPATLSYPPGTALLSHDEIAELIAAEVGNPVSYGHIPADQWRAQLENAAQASEAVVNADMAQHISSIGEGFALGLAAKVVPDPQAVTAAIGRQPMSFAEFVEANRDAFVRQ
jgi:uncharacterized protein YbjT (DUF2867 family)